MMNKTFGLALALAGMLTLPVAAQSDGAGYTQDIGKVVRATASELTVKLTDGTETTWDRAQLREADTARGSWGTPVNWREGDELKVFTKAGGLKALPIAAKLTDAVYGVDVDYFRADGKSANERLLINGLARTKVSDAAGAQMPKDVVLNNDLLVFYTIATASLPPQTVPDKVVVLSETAAEAAAGVAPKASQPTDVTPAPAETPQPATPAVTADAMPSLGETQTADRTSVYAVRDNLTRWGATVGWEADTETVLIDWLGHAYRLSIPDKTLTIDGAATYRVGEVQLLDGVAYADREVFAALWQLGQLDR